MPSKSNCAGMSASRSAWAASSFSLPSDRKDTAAILADIEAKNKNLTDRVNAQQIELRWNVGIKIGLGCLFLLAAFRSERHRGHPGGHRGEKQEPDRPGECPANRTALECRHQDRPGLPLPSRCLQIGKTPRPSWRTSRRKTRT